MTGKQLRAYLDSEEEETRKTVSIEDLDELIEKNIRMNMDKENVSSRMQGLFAD